jgi:aryl-alcohol dehydrogenase-like predicted oxidoreductase
MISGRATPEGTARYAGRFAATSTPEHFRQLAPAGRLSSLGLGTYLGRDDDATDGLYRRAIGRAIQRGINVLDTAVNYRNQRSERVVGAALADLTGRAVIQRDEVVVATKGGYIPLDAASPQDPRTYITETYLRPGIIRSGDVVGGSHCMTPRYLADQIERSRANLGIATIDVYYLHNPESQLEAVDRAEFLIRMRAAFAALEEAVGAGRIGCYGTATWTGYRQAPDAPDHLSLEELVGLAREVAGADHHFKVVQLPYNLGMPEAYTRANQRLDGLTVPLLEAAQRLGIYVMASASVHQGQLTRNQPEILSELVPGLATDAQRALQFVRSTPGVGTALVGMKSVDHVEENRAVAAVAPMTREQFQRLFTEG